jgi:hypothetical protein
MHRIIDFLRTLLNSQITSNPFNEIAHWSLIRNLSEFQWRIPSIWHNIIEHVKESLDHSSAGVREHIAK